MLIRKSDNHFRPIDIRIESEEEAATLWAAMQYANRQDQSRLLNGEDKYRGLWFTHHALISSERLSSMFERLTTHLREGR